MIHLERVRPPELLNELRIKLHERFGLDHLTIQMETAEFEDETFHFCHAGTACFKSGALGQRAVRDLQPPAAAG